MKADKGLGTRLEAGNLEKMAECWKFCARIGSLLDELMNKVIRILQCDQVDNWLYIVCICKTAIGQGTEENVYIC